MSDEISDLDHRFGLRDKKIEALEKKFEALKDTCELYGTTNKEQIARLHKQVNNNATEVDTRFSISETVLRDFMEVIRTYACEEISECIPELQEKLKSYPVQNRIDRLDAGLKIMKKHEEWVKERFEATEKKEVVIRDRDECFKITFHDKELRQHHCIEHNCSNLSYCQSKKDSGGEKDVSEVDETGGATPTRNVEFDTSSLLGDDSKPPESKHTCSFCGRNLILYKQEWICGHGCIKHAILPKGTGPEKEGGMPYFRINCPFCEGHSVSDVIDSIKEVDGQWECSNGHQFVVKYLGKIE